MVVHATWQRVSCITPSEVRSRGLAAYMYVKYCSKLILQSTIVAAQNELKSVIGLNKAVTSFETTSVAVDKSEACHNHLQVANISIHV